jgi:cytochrome c peroxidase
MVRHHLDPINSLENYDTTQALLPDTSRWGDRDFVEHNNLENRAEMIGNNQLAPVQLSERQITDLILFLHALTDPAALDLRHTIPATVPSGLPVWD